MNYQKIYNAICERGRSDRVVDTYCEKHHIIPKCLGGSNDKTNLTVLTFREHYIAHKLLCKLHKNVSGIQYAFLCMLRKQPKGNRVITSKMYEEIKKQFSEFKKQHIKIFNPGKSEKSRLAAKNRMINKNPIKLNPEKNWKAQPIKIFFIDGRVEEYSYAKEFCNISGVPYNTMKHRLQKGCNSRKHGIKRIERV